MVLIFLSLILIIVIILFLKTEKLTVNTLTTGLPNTTTHRIGSLLTRRLYFDRS
jgi:hypothetical protein